MKIVKKGTIDIWYHDLSKLKHDERTTYYQSIISLDESLRLERYGSRALKENFLYRRGILKVLVGHYLSERPSKYDFKYGPFGKPYIENVPLHFNLSYSQNGVVMAFSDSPVGVDIEFCKPMIEFDQIARHFFATNEAEKVQSLKDEYKMEAFYRCWTRKEAFIKCRGDGLTYPLDKFEVTISEDQEAEVIQTNDPRERAGDWNMHTLNLPEGYIGALAYKGERRELRYQDSSKLHYLDPPEN